MDKLLHVRIEMDILPKSNISTSNYHRRAIEGPLIRCIMIKGPEVFKEISNILKMLLEKETCKNLATTRKSNMFVKYMVACT